MNWLNNLLKHRAPQIPNALWQSCVAHHLFFDGLSNADLARLKSVAESILDSKTITGAGGLTLSDDIAVSIAAQAALPILNLTLDLYRDMSGIVVYPSAFIVSHSEMDANGVVHEWREPLSGEAIGAGGVVVLSWEDVLSDDDPGLHASNITIHEFAHKIDMARGDANGCPCFLAAYHQGMDVNEWRRVFLDAYDNFAMRVDSLNSLDAQLRRSAHYQDADDLNNAALLDAAFASLPMDPYAAEDPAEFFAVASEVFFVMPEPLAEDYPDVYRLLTRYYRQDPLADLSKKYGFR